MSGGFKEIGTALLNALMVLLIIFGLIFVLSGSANGLDLSNGNFGLGMTLVIAGGAIMFVNAYIKNRL